MHPSVLIAYILFTSIDSSWGLSSIFRSHRLTSMPSFSAGCAGNQYPIEWYYNRRYFLFPRRRVLLQEYINGSRDQQQFSWLANGSSEGGSYVSKKTRTSSLLVPSLDKPKYDVSVIRWSLISLIAMWSLIEVAARAIKGVSPLHWLWTSLRWSIIWNRTSQRAMKWTILSYIVLWTALDSYQTRRRQRQDATSEWSRYAIHPGARGRALFSLLMVQLLPLASLGRLLAILKMQKRSDLLMAYSGRVFADGLLQLGPLYIKMGQIVSCRENLLPDAWTKSLERLQDQVPSKSGEQALQLAYAAWPGGSDSFHKTFVDFETTPLAAASLGQVHKAKLRVGTGKSTETETVAIKLQRPYLREIYDKDFVLLTKIAAAVDRFGGSTGQVGGVSQSWVEIFKDAEDILYREIDYRDEAENAIRFCADFGLDKGGQPALQTMAKSKDGQPLLSAANWLRSPYVYKDLSSEKVLTMEYVPSIKVTSMGKLEAYGVSQEDKEYLADCLGRAYLRMFCCNLFFSTDPHPGNLGVEVLNLNSSKPEERVRLVFYDFGQAASLKETQGEGILDIVEAIVDMNVDRSLESFRKMGVLKDNANMEAVRAKIADNYKTGKVKANRKRLSKRGYQFKEPISPTEVLINSVPSTSTTTMTTSTKMNSISPPKDSEVMQYFILPAEYAFVGRALGQMDGVGKTLDPEFDFISAAAPYLYEVKGTTKYLQEEANKWINNALIQIKSIFSL